MGFEVALCECIMRLVGWWWPLLLFLHPRLSCSRKTYFCQKHSEFANAFENKKRGNTKDGMDCRLQEGIFCPFRLSIRVKYDVLARPGQQASIFFFKKVRYALSTSHSGKWTRLIRNKIKTIFFPFPLLPMTRLSCHASKSTKKDGERKRERERERRISINVSPTRKIPQKSWPGKK